jgi:hypothetical protein
VGEDGRAAPQTAPRGRRRRRLVGIKDVVVGEGDSFDEALRDVQSALRFHIETFGTDALEPEDPILDAFIGEAAIV